MIDAGLCSYRDARERLSLDEVMDLHEVLVAKIENEHRAHQAAEKKAKEKRQ